MLVGLASVPRAIANDNADTERSIRLYASARFGPIGHIRSNSLSSGTVAIDGRIAQGDAPIWGGELIKAIADRKVSVKIDSIGQVSLASGAMVRLGTARTAANEGSYEVLVASLIGGNIEVKLDATAGAYVEAAGSTYISGPGASFRAGIEGDRATLVTVTGVVRVQDPVPPQDVKIRIVDELGRPVASGSQLSVRARSTRQIQVQVTDKNDKPLPDLPVLFSLGDPCLGSLGLGVAAGSTFRQKTDKRGIAAVPLVAGAARCAASVLAKVEGTNASVSIQTNVVQQKGFWNTQNTLLVVAAGAGAGVAAGLIVANQGNNEPIRPVPPPQVKP
jgi:hypothetical protein